MIRATRSSRIVLRISIAIGAVAVPSLTSMAAYADGPPTSSSASRGALVGAGAAAFTLGYGYAAAMGGFVYRSDDGHVPSDVFVPIAGPYLALAQGEIPARTLLSVRAGDAYFRDRHGAATFGDAAVFVGALFGGAVEYTALVLAPIAQGAGVTSMALGVAVSNPPQPKSSKPKISFAPTWSSGPGVSMQVSSW